MLSLAAPEEAAVTVTRTGVGVVVAPRGEPVTVKLYKPGVTEDATLTVKSLVAPDEETVTGLTVRDSHVIPEGRDEATQDNVTGRSVPEVRVPVTVTLPDMPC